MITKGMKCILVAVFSLCITFFSNALYAQQVPKGEDHVTDEKFDPAKEIMGHIQDAYEFHFFTLGDFHATIHLPVLLYSSQRGFSAFSSSKFGHDGTEEYDGYKLQAGSAVPVNPEEKIFDFSLTKNVVQMFIALIVLVLLMTGIARKYKSGKGVLSAPSGWQNAIEPVITFVRDDVAKIYLGKRYERYMPYLLTIFFFILINNIFGLIPGSANVTGNVAFTIVLGVISFIVIMASSNKHFWGHIFNPHVPWGIKPILVPVELLGVFTKPFALIVRLFANMVAGHIIILSFVSLIFIFGGMNKAAGWGFSPISVLFTVFIYLIEIMVAFIQAFIFTNLTAVFIGQAFEGSDHDADGHDDGIIPS